MKTKIEMKFSFKAINEILKTTNSTLDTLGELSKNLDNIPLIAFIGHKHFGGNLTKEQIEDILDNGNWEDALQIVTEFSEQVSRYFNPNEASPLPSTT